MNKKDILQTLKIQVPKLVKNYMKHGIFFGLHTRIRFHIKLSFATSVTKQRDHYCQNRKIYHCIFKIVNVTTTLVLTIKSLTTKCIRLESTATLTPNVMTAEVTRGTKDAWDLFSPNRISVLRPLHCFRGL